MTRRDYTNASGAHDLQFQRDIEKVKAMKIERRERIMSEE